MMLIACSYSYHLITYSVEMVTHSYYCQEVV